MEHMQQHSGDKLYKRSNNDVAVGGPAATCAGAGVLDCKPRQETGGNMHVVLLLWLVVAVLAMGCCAFVVA